MTESKLKAMNNVKPEVVEHFTIDEILFKVQVELGPILKDAKNAHFKNKYATLDKILESVSPILHSHGLMTTSDVIDGKLVTTLSSPAVGAEKTYTMPLILQQENMQGLGSAITYARRYTLGIMLNLTFEDDDDGNAASGQTAVGNGKSEAGKAVATVDQLSKIKALAVEAEYCDADASDLVKQLNDRYMRPIFGKTVKSGGDILRYEANQIINDLVEAVESSK